MALLFHKLCDFYDQQSCINTQDQTKNECVRIGNQSLLKKERSRHYISPIVNFYNRKIILYVINSILVDYPTQL